MMSPNDDPRWYSGYYDDSGMWRIDWKFDALPTVGSSYEYKIERSDSVDTEWEISIDGGSFRTYDVSMTTGRVVQAGGEVTKFSDETTYNAMGPANLYSVSYKSALDERWYRWSRWNYLVAEDGYVLVQLGNSFQHFKTYGHNP